MDIFAAVSFLAFVLSGLVSAELLAPELGPELDPELKDCNVPRMLIREPVCGSNGITYPNMHYFDCAQEKLAYQHTYISVVHNGYCDKGCVFSDTFKPVCGSNGISYYNEAELNCDRRKLAQQGKNIFFKFMGTCQYYPERSAAQSVNIGILSVIIFVAMLIVKKC